MLKKIFTKKEKLKPNNNYKICAYCICKNESKFVDRFMDSLEEIKDHVYVLDTGSTDNTVELFKKRGAKVQQKFYEHFAFDEARNDSLKLIPEDYDICICLDVDEIIHQGFTEVLNKVWKSDTTQLEYPFYLTLDENNNPIVQFMNNKIHSRKDFKWIYPIHEVLEYTGNNRRVAQTKEIIVVHKPDSSKSRAFYLDLLEKRVEDVPDDTRNTYLLAREYNVKSMWEKSIKTCKKYLDIEKPKAVSEKVQIMCLMSNSYRFLKNYEQSIFWANEAIKESEITREPYLEKIITEFEEKKYKELIETANKALEIKKYNMNIIDKAACWDGTIYDYLSLAYYYLGDYDNAIKYINIDIEKNPNIERLKENKKIFEDAKLLSKNK